MTRMENQTEYRAKRGAWFRRLLLTLLLLLLVLTGLRMLLKSDRALDLLRERVVHEVNERIRGTFVLSDLRGDLLYGVTLSGVSLADGSGTMLLEADTISLRYSLPQLIGRSALDALDLKGLRIFLEQDEQGRWNVQKLLPESGERVEARDEVSPPFWSVGQLRLRRSAVTVRSPQLPEDRIRISEFELSASGGYGESGWNIRLGDLRFLLDEGRLPRAIELHASARADGEEVTLSRLLAATGRSLIVLGADWSREKGLFAGAELDPVSAADLALYADLPLQQDLSGYIGVEGDFESMRLFAELSAEGLGSMSGEVTFEPGPEVAIRDPRIDIERIDGPSLTGNDALPGIAAIRFRSSGRVPIGEPEKSDLNGELLLEGIAFAEGEADGAEARFELAGDRLLLDLTLNRFGQKLRGELDLRHPFSVDPAWDVVLRTEDLDLAELLADSTFQSGIHGEIHLSGRGYALSDRPVRVTAESVGSRFRNQTFDELRLDGELTAETARGEMNLRINESRAGAQFELENWQTEPVYAAGLVLNRFDLADITGPESFPTQLNATVELQGRYLDAERRSLNGSVQFDSSFVNREPVEQLRAAMELQGTILQITDATLRSPIADVSFGMRHDLANLQDPQNRLDLDGEIKYLQPLAPLFGVESLQGSGFFGGRLDRDDTGPLQFHGQIVLEDLLYDSLYASRFVEGSVSARITQEPEIRLRVRAERPAVGDLQIRSAEIGAEIDVRDSLRTGRIELGVEDEQHSIRHGAGFEQIPGRFRLVTDRLEMVSPELTLQLDRPFEFARTDTLFRMEPLRIVSETGVVHFEVEIPHFEQNYRELRFELEQFNLGAIQSALFGERHFDSMMSGRFHYRETDGELLSDARLHFGRIGYQEGELDSLRLDFSVSEKRLDWNAGAWHEGRERFRLDADLPFEPGDPVTFDEAFYSQPVRMEIELPDSEIGFWKAFVPGGDRVDAEGQISFSAEVSGTAGSPDFNGEFLFSGGHLSGVPLDDFTFGFTYLHEASTVDLAGEFHSTGTRVAEFAGSLPFYLDVRRFRVDLPDDSDEVVLWAETESFDLALFSDFLDREQLDDLGGVASGRFRLEGPIAALRPSGNLTVRDGRLRVVPVNVNLVEISSDLSIEPDRLELSAFSMRSGPGRATASGTVSLEGLQPWEFDLQLDAIQFRVANTQETTAIVDLSSRLDGRPEHPRLRGDLRVRNGFLFLRNFGEQAVEDVRLEDEPEAMPFPLYELLEMEMSLSVDRQFFIRNRQYLDMEVELAGTLDLVKEPEGELQLFGTVEGVRGYARPLGRLFELDDANVTFYGPADNPELTIRTRYRPPRSGEEITIWYLVEGPVQDPEFRFESEPFLELQDIISYTLFGRPFYALESWQQALTGGGTETTAGDMALELLIDRVGTLAAQRLGIDVVEIDTHRSGSGSSTTIKTGWYLSERTFFAVMNEISGSSPKTLFLLEYLLRRNLELIVTQGDDSREGIDIRWRYDY